MLATSSRSLTVNSGLAGADDLTLAAVCVPCPKTVAVGKEAARLINTSKQTVVRSFFIVVASFVHFQRCGDGRFIQSESGYAQGSCKNRKALLACCCCA